jgi:hypothetical protein
MNSAISAKAFPGILYKNGVFGEENPCHYSINIATNRTKKPRKKTGKG